MEKGKTKKQKNYMSIVLVPHSSDGVRVLKFSSPHVKLASLFVVLLTVIVCMSLVLVQKLDENNKLKNYVNVLTKTNIEQKNLVSIKLSEIEKLKSTVSDKGAIVAELTKKCEELTEKYTNRAIDTAKASRSGNGGEASYISELKQLQNLLKSLKELENGKSSALEKLTETEAKLKKYMDTVPTFWPVSGRISSYFGSRSDPINGGKGNHEGLDIAADSGVNIRAAACGKVTFSGYSSGYGYNIVVDHGHGLSTRYGHASKLLVTEGKTVTKGQIIAKVGSTGRSTGPHLHFEVLLNDNPVDPLKYLDNK